MTPELTAMLAMAIGALVRELLSYLERTERRRGHRRTRATDRQE